MIETHDRAQIQVRNGIDPRKPEAPEEAGTKPDNLTIAQLKDKWCSWSQKHHSAKWHNTLKLALEKDFIPIYGQRMALEIRKKDAVAILENKASTAPGQAVNLHKALRGMWEYALDREIVEFNPFAAIKPARTIPSMKQAARERILNDEEIKYLWTAIGQGGGSDSTQQALKLMLLTGQRNG